MAITLSGPFREGRRKGLVRDATDVRSTAYRVEIQKRSDRSPKRLLQDCEANGRAWVTIIQISLNRGVIVSVARQHRDAAKFLEAVLFLQHALHDSGTSRRFGEGLAPTSLWMTAQGAVAAGRTLW
ncbi:MAG TPA: hypothetical protein VJR58_20805 [Vineibacter sp.]|nr:hypothetical protein [Vineibacter sp.]